MKPYSLPQHLVSDLLACLVASRVSFGLVTLGNWIPEKGTLDHYCEHLSRLALGSPPATDGKSKQCFVYTIVVASRDWCLLEWPGASPGLRPHLQAPRKRNRAPVVPPSAKREEIRSPLGASRGRRKGGAFA